MKDENLNADADNLERILLLMSEKLEHLCRTSDVYLKFINEKPIEDFIEENENADYALPFEETLVKMMNSVWDKEMETSEAKNKEAINKDDFEYIANDVEKASEVLQKVIKDTNLLLDNATQAIDNGSFRYGCEIYKYIKKSMTASKEYYTEQKQYVDKRLCRIQQEKDSPKENDI